MPRKISKNIDDLGEFCKLPLDAKTINEATNEYHKSIDRFNKLVQAVVERVESELKRHSILARVSGRVKNRDNLARKLEKWSLNNDKSNYFNSGNDVFSLVGDLAAVRVMTYVEQDRERVADIIKEIFTHRPLKSDFEYEKKEESPRIKTDESNYYRATHMQICLRPEEIIGNNSNLKDDHCEIQITSMLAHVWNEIEHDIVYKSDKSLLADDEISAIDSLGLLTKSGDNIIVSLINANVRRKANNKIKQTLANEEIVDGYSLSEALVRFYGYFFGGRRVDLWRNNEPLFKALAHLKITSPREVYQVLSPSLLHETQKVTIPAFKRFLSRNGLKRPALAPDTCDLFLIALMTLYWTELTKQPHSAPGPRPRQIAFAFLFERFKSAADV